MTHFRWWSSYSGLWLLAASLAACSADAANTSESSSSIEAISDDAAADAGRVGARPCGEVGMCPVDGLCVQTRGAVCMPLPPPGESCPADCRPTEHCCNCPAFACVQPPEEDCKGEVSCDCISETPALRNCPPERRECTETPQGVDVLCINVDFDEDPFADAGARQSHGSDASQGD